eukprot:7116945-Prymnesium_polylepis.1
MRPPFVCEVWRQGWPFKLHVMLYGLALPPLARPRLLRYGLCGMQLHAAAVIEINSSMTSVRGQNRCSAKCKCELASNSTI